MLFNIKPSVLQIHRLSSTVTGALILTISLTLNAPHSPLFKDSLLKVVNLGAIFFDLRGWLLNGALGRLLAIWTKLILTWLHLSDFNARPVIVSASLVFLHEVISVGGAFFELTRGVLLATVNNVADGGDSVFRPDFAHIVVLHEIAALNFVFVVPRSMLTRPHRYVKLSIDRLVFHHLLLYLTSSSIPLQPKYKMRHQAYHYQFESKVIYASCEQAHSSSLDSN